MKAKIYVGDEATGKTRLARIISEYIGKERTVFICGAKAIMINCFAFSEVTNLTRYYGKR